jgi:hypothetical protein
VVLELGFMCRCVARVEHDDFLGVDDFIFASLSLVYFASCGMVANLHVLVHEIFSTFDVQLVLRKWLCGCLSLTPLLRLNFQMVA